MENLELYNKVRKVPQEAQKEITAGRLKGKTDINPMWRIKTLTEQFGICGLGWYTELIRKELTEGADGEVVATVEINLYVKVGNEWSKPIYGIGGAMFISNEKNGKYNDDDAYKKAYTDAISVACKALGIGADVYYAKDATKYDEVGKTEKKSKTENGEAEKKPFPGADEQAKAERDKRKEDRTKEISMLITKSSPNIDETKKNVNEFVKTHGYGFGDMPQALYDELKAKIELHKL